MYEYFNDIVTFYSYVVFLFTVQYSKTSLSFTVTPIPVLAGSSSTSLQMCTVQLSPKSNCHQQRLTPLQQKNRLPQAHLNTSDGELGHINCSGSSSKSRARHYLLKELH
jgi:hypothetical protein